MTDRYSVSVEDRVVQLGPGELERVPCVVIRDARPIVVDHVERVYALIGSAWWSVRYRRAGDGLPMIRNNQVRSGVTVALLRAALGKEAACGVGRR